MIGLISNTIKVFEDFLFVYECVCVCVCDMCTGAQKISQKRVLAPMALDIQAVVKHPTWVMGLELESSALTTDLNR